MCYICGFEIDRALPLEMTQHPSYWTADHDPPLAEGNSLLVGLKSAPWGCNSAKGRAMQLAEVPDEPVEYA